MHDSHGSLRRRQQLRIDVTAILGSDAEKGSHCAASEVALLRELQIRSRRQSQDTDDARTTEGSTGPQHEVAACGVADQDKLAIVLVYQCR